MRLLRILSRYNIALMLIVLFPLDQLLTSIFPSLIISPFRILTVLLSFLFVKYDIKKLDPFTIVFLLFFVYCTLSLISTFWAEDVNKSILYTLQLAMSLFFTIVVVSEFINDEKIFKKLTFYGCIVGGIIAQLSLLGVFSGRELSLEYRLSFAGIGMNAVAISIGFTFILGIAYLIDSKNNRINRVLILISCVIIFYFLIRTGTRSSIFGVIIALATAYLLTFKLTFTNIVKLLISGLVVLFSFNSIMDNYIGEGLANRVSSIGADDIESNSRKILWITAFNWYADNMLGTGSGNEAIVYVNSGAKEAHNVFVSSLLQLNFLGFIIIVFIMIKILLNLFTIKDKMLKFTSFSVYVFLLLQMMKGSFLQNRIFWIPIIIILTLTLLDKKRVAFNTNIAKINFKYKTS